MHLLTLGSKAFQREHSSFFLVPTGASLFHCTPVCIQKPNLEKKAIEENAAARCPSEQGSARSG